MSRGPAGASHAPVYRSGKSLTRYLPQVVAATLLVAVAPVVAVWLLRSAGVLQSPWVCLVLAMALSTALSWTGCAYWKRSKGSGDLLFSELLVWGWLQRWHVERQLDSAVALLGLLPTDREAHSRDQPVERQQQLLRQVAGALEAEDRYTRGHSDRVARYAVRIARKLGLSKPEVETIRAAALVHDVGKLLIAPEILDKPARLTDAEFEVIKRHPVDGAEMVAGLGNDELTAIVRHHHERLDGNGYPDGLAGERIPLGARIIAVADTFDAITSVRAYRPRREHKKALDILTGEQGHQLDRNAVRAFLACYSGRRSVALWAVVISGLERTVSWLTGEASAATITAGNVMATAVATVAIGGVAMASPLAVLAAPDQAASTAHFATGSAGQSRLTSRPSGAGIGRPGPGLHRGRGPALAPRSGVHDGLRLSGRRSRRGHARVSPRAGRSRTSHVAVGGPIAPRRISDSRKAHKTHPAKKAHETHSEKVHRTHRAKKVHRTHRAKKVHKTHPARVHKVHPAKPDGPPGHGHGHGRGHGHG